MTDTVSFNPDQDATEQLTETVALDATDEVAGGVLPIVAAVAGAAGFVTWCANGGLQDSTDLVSGFIEGWSSATN